MAWKAASGTPAEVLTAENLAAVYGARVWVRPHPATGRPLVLSLPELPGEQIGPARPHVHVVCGGGTGAGLLLTLHRLGFPLTAACLHTGDADADAAQMLGIPFAEEAAFSLLSYAALENAAHLAGSADIVLLTETPFGRANAANLEAVLALRRAGKPVLCQQSPSSSFGARDFTGGSASKAWASLLAEGAVVLPSADAALTYLEQCGTSTDAKR